jgi:hypothetical protein
MKTETFPVNKSAARHAYVAMFFVEHLISGAGLALRRVLSRQAVCRYDQRMNATEAGLDAEDIRQRCVTHNRWMTDHPEVVEFAEDWADRNLEDLLQR